MTKYTPNGQNTNNKTGVKVVTNQDWNQLQDSLSQGSFGNEQVTFNEMGIEYPDVSVFAPHEGTIDQADLKNLIIGQDREENWYPCADYIGVGCPKMNIWIAQDTLVLKAQDEWRVVDFQYSTPEHYNITLPIPDKHTPEVPDTIGTEHTLVRYKIPHDLKIKKVREYDDAFERTDVVVPERDFEAGQEVMTNSEIRDIVRRKRMNWMLGAEHNYVSPDEKERYKFWKLFSKFNYISSEWCMLSL